ncbi:hypothetical protein F9U64_20295 [Gracilibacillus oryzae]|uniref:Endospore appendages core domain-containing protein n=1 Tax=Gracilibacillus oryzae TaxID=1672701 RepID=A0A7C8KPM8_9BACI|nr:S-Ena type endospore appendage [Gracilibacillus oryzae]KAB8126284.1 hypothetical protein F9U64_20295 [Gracilibacillus oryzae]
MHKDMEKHFINVTKLIDWITKPAELQITKQLNCPQYITDKVCGNIELLCGERALLWQANGDLTVSGTVTVSHIFGCDYMEIIINGKAPIILSNGEEKTWNTTDLQTLEVRFNGVVSDICIGKYCLSLRYKLKSKDLPSKDCQVTCFLSDQFGNPEESVLCSIIPSERETFLQKVSLQLKGFITICFMHDGKRIP